MKTFEEFLDEALKSSVVQASARHQYQSQAVKQRVGGGRSSGSSPGSISTKPQPTIPVRNHWSHKPVAGLSVPSKAPKKLEYQKLYHGTTKPSSQAISKGGWKTDVNVSQQKRGPGVYVTPDKKTAIGYAAGKVRQQGGTPDWNNLGIRRFNMPKNVYNDAMRRQSKNPNDWANISQVKQVTMKPSYANKIDITDKSKNAVDLKNTQRKELRQRVNTVLSKPQNRAALKPTKSANPTKGGRGGRGGGSGLRSSGLGADSSPAGLGRFQIGTGTMFANSYEPDVFDVILEYLLDEGYAETPQAAEAIMVNMSEEWREFISELTQSELDVESKKVNQNTRNAPIQRQQSPSQPDGTPQRPTGVPIPGTGVAFKKATNVVRAGVSAVVNR